MQKQKRIQWSNDFDIDNLESAGCWETIEELQSVIMFNIHRYTDILNDCKNNKDTVKPEGISYATKFCCHISVYEGKRDSTNDISVINISHD